MLIEWSPYVLESFNGSNVSAKATRRQGALLKVSDQNGFGVSDLHPWPSLGDGLLQTHIKSLVALQPTALAQRALELAQADYQSRSSGQSKSSPSISNNYVIPPAKPLSEEMISYLESESISVVKMKCGVNSEEELQKIERLSQRGISVRLDFNSSSSVERVQNFWQRLSDSAKKKIEYVEDPVYYHREEWLRLSEEIPLACDFEISRVDFSKPVPFRNLIIKPTRQRPLDLWPLIQQHQLKVTLTSSMDHPWGIVQGLCEAESLRSLHPSNLNSAHGFWTHQLDQPTEASQALSVSKGVIHWDGSVFESYFSKLPWTQSWAAV